MEFDDSPTFFIDENKNVFYVDSELSRGSQGVVFRLTDSNLAAKISLVKVNSALYRKLRLLPLPAALPITMPLSVITTGGIGYIMKLLNGMKSLEEGYRKLRPMPADWVSPAHLQNVNAEKAWNIVQYAQGGGIRKRLEILSSAAMTMARLHAAGLCYGDISMNNLFYTPSKNQVWWIDPDNIRPDQTANQTAVYTPGYGAPEVVRREASCSCAGDVFSMSVLAHVLLTDVFPFDGAMVAMVMEMQGWDEDGMTAQELMMRGEYPWIFDEEDNSNEGMGILPPVRVLGESLTELMGRIFGEGRLNPQKRPTMLKLAQTLCSSWLDTVRCSNPECGMSWFSACSEEDAAGVLNCPYCGTAVGGYLRITSYGFTTDGSRKKLVTMVREIGNDTEIEIPQYVLFPYTLLHFGRMKLGIRLSGAELRIRRADDEPGVWHCVIQEQSEVLDKVNNSFNILNLNGKLNLLYIHESAPAVELELNWKTK